MPAEWLADLKNAIQESKTKLIITTVLSSSLITGVFSTVGSYYLEGKKSRLVFQRVLANVDLPKYTLLGNEVGKLESKVQSTSTIIKAALDHQNRTRKDALGVLPNQISALEDQIAKVKDSVTVLMGEEGAATRKVVEENVNILGGKAATAHLQPNDPQALTDLLNSCESMKSEGMNNMRTQINSAMQSLVKKVS